MKSKHFNSKYTVVFFEPYPMGLGGNYLTQRLILERIDRNLFNPIVISPLEGIALDRYRAMGVQCEVIEPPEILNKYGRQVLRLGLLNKLLTGFYLLKYNLKLRKILVKFEANIVYTNCVRSFMYIGIAARLSGVPSLLYIKGELANPLLDRFCLLAANKILFFCVQNRDDKYRYFVRLFQSKIQVLGIGMDLSVVHKVEGLDCSSLRVSLELDSNFSNAVILAQLYHPKGQHFAIEALAKVVATFPNTRLYLLGDHVLEEYRPYKSQLDNLISKYGLEDNVRFTGWRSDALQVVSQMDIVIHPSLSEGFGRAVLESMALGKPVIASAVGGLREAIVDGVNGYLIVPGDIDSLANRWRELISSPELRQEFGNQASKTVLKHYQIEDKIIQLSEIWSDMASGGR